MTIYPSLLNSVFIFKIKYVFKFNLNLSSDVSTELLIIKAENIDNDIGLHFRLTKYFLQKGIDQLKNKSDNDNEKGVLEKLLEINEEVAYIMASDMLFAGVDTVSTNSDPMLYLRRNTKKFWIDTSTAPHKLE